MTARHPSLVFLQRWGVITLAVLVAAHVVRGIHYDSIGGLLTASLLLGILNTFLRPLIFLLSLPLLILTLGLFMILINAGLLYLVAALVPSFQVSTFLSAIGGALVISVVSLLVNRLVGSPPVNFRFHRHRSSPPPRDPGADGPIIDV